MKQSIDIFEKRHSHTINMILQNKNIKIVDSNHIVSSPNLMDEIEKQLDDSYVGHMFLYTGPTTDKYEYRSMHVVVKDGDGEKVRFTTYSNPDIVTIDGGEI